MRPQTNDKQPQRLPNSWIYRADPLAICQRHDWRDDNGVRWCAVCGVAEVTDK